MLDWTICAAVERNPQKVSGVWIFRGTRVPVSALFANIEGGATVDEFIEWFQRATNAGLQPRRVAAGAYRSERYHTTKWRFPNDHLRHVRRSQSVLTKTNRG